LPLPLAWAKNVNEYKLAYKSLASNEVNQHAPTWLIFWWGGLGVLDFYCPNLFPSNSQWVFKMSPSFQCVPQHFPHNTSLYFISFALSSTLVTYSTNPKREHYNICILGLSKNLFFFNDGPITNAHEKRKQKKLWGSP
jgi:hypothetical protein